MSRKPFVVEINDIDTAIKILKKLSDPQYVQFGEGDDAIQQFAKKQLEYGHFLAEYLGDEPVGYICFYANDHVTQMAYVTALVVAGTGFLQGRLFYELLAMGARIGISAGMTSAKIEVYKDNMHARKLYEKMGFVYTGEENDRGLYMTIDYKILADTLKIKL